MKRGKKIALIALMVVVALAGTIGGVVMAQSEEEETTTTPENARFAYLERVCEIYQERTGVAINADDLKEALCQAGEEQREQARNQFRQRLIDEGIMTEEELAAWEEWLQSKPEILSEEFEEWLQSRPDDLPGRFGCGMADGKRFAFVYGHGFGHGIVKGIGGGFGGWCPQDNGTE